MTHKHVLQSPPWFNLPFPTLVTDNCKQAKLLLEKCDAGEEKKIQSYLGHTDVRGLCAYHNRNVLDWIFKRKAAE